MSDETKAAWHNEQAEFNEEQAQRHEQRVAELKEALEAGTPIELTPEELEVIKRFREDN